MTKVYILESFTTNGESEIEGVFSTRCLAEAHEWICWNDQETYHDCEFYISEEVVDGAVKA